MTRRALAFANRQTERFRVDIGSMEPMVPEEASRALDDYVLPLVAEAKGLAGRIRLGRPR
jgi:hypothetical protein